MDQFFKVLCIVMMVPAVVYGQSWGQCSANEVAPQRIRVNGCNADTDQFCTVVPSRPAQIQIQFAPNDNSRQLTSEIHAILGNQLIPFNIGRQSDVCTHLQVGRCPIPARQPVIYTIGLNIPNQAPPGTDLLVRLRAANENRQQQFCFLLRVRVIRG